MKAASVLKTCKTPLIALLCSSMIIPHAWARSTIDNLADLNYQDYHYAKRELRNRGYTFIQADERHNRATEYWWQGSDNICARITRADGKVSGIAGVSPTDCNQQASDNHTAAKVAIGAAALLGVAMLLHKSHERDEQKYTSQQDVAEFERGYRDGMYHNTYHDYNHAQAYVDGYNAGQQKRSADTTYHSPHGHHSGNATYVQLNDLVGARASSVDSNMEQRGFRRTGGYKSDGHIYATWWNAGSRQCVQLTTDNGRLQSISNLVEGNCN